jgi:hypothetical protein
MEKKKDVLSWCKDIDRNSMGSQSESAKRKPIRMHDMAANKNQEFFSSCVPSFSIHFDSCQLLWEVEQSVLRCIFGSCLHAKERNGMRANNILPSFFFVAQRTLYQAFSLESN